MSITMKGLLFMQPDISTWSGAVKFNQNRGDELPRQLVSNGTLHLVPQTEIAAPQSTRAYVRRIGLDLGFPCLGFAAVPLVDAEELVRQLDLQRARFQTSVDEIIERLPELYAQQCARFPAQESLIEQHKLDANTVRGRYRFGVLTTELQVPTQVDAQRLFTEASATVLPDLLGAIAARAGEILMRMANTPDAGSQRVLKATRRLVTKLGRFSMVDPRCAPASAAYATLLDGMPKTGELDVGDSFALRQVLAQLTDPGQILDLGRQTISHAAVIAARPQQVAIAMPEQDATSVDSDDEAFESPVVITPPLPAPAQAPAAQPWVVF